MDKSHFEKNLKTLSESGLPKFEGLDLSTFNTIGWLIANHFSYMNTKLCGDELMLDVSANEMDRVFIFKGELVYEFNFNKTSDAIETIKIFKTKVVEIGVKYEKLAAVDDWVSINVFPAIECLELELEEYNDIYKLDKNSSNYKITEVYEMLKNKF